MKNKQFINYLKNKTMTLFNKYTKWQLVDIYVYAFDKYTVHCRVNLRTGYKQFKVKNIGNYTGNSKITAELVNETFKEMEL
jgi:hypothetical protein